MHKHAAAAEQPHQAGNAAGGGNGCLVGMAVGSQIPQRPGRSLLHTLAAASQRPHQRGDAALGCDGCLVGIVVDSQIPQRPGCTLLRILAAAVLQPHQGGMPPSAARAAWLAWLSTAIFHSVKASPACAPSLALPSRRTRQGMAPAAAKPARLATLAARIASMLVASSCTLPLPLPSRRTKGGGRRRLQWLPCYLAVGSQKPERPSCRLRTPAAAAQQLHQVGIPPAAAMAAWLATLAARIDSALAARTCSLTLPLPSRCTRGGCPRRLRWLPGY